MGGPARQRGYANITSAPVRVWSPSNVTWKSAFPSPFMSAVTYVKSSSVVDVSSPSCSYRTSPTEEVPAPAPENAVVPMNVKVAPASTRPAPTATYTKIRSASVKVCRSSSFTSKSARYSPSASAFPSRSTYTYVKSS